VAAIARTARARVSLRRANVSRSWRILTRLRWTRREIPLRASRRWLAA